jgi:hypothetical protein
MFIRFRALVRIATALRQLTDWSLKLIDLQYVMSTQFTDLSETLLKIRLIKCGIRLCGHLCVLTEELSNDWIVRCTRSSTSTSTSRPSDGFLSETRLSIETVGLVRRQVRVAVGQTLDHQDLGSNIILSVGFTLVHR